MNKEQFIEYLNGLIRYNKENKKYWETKGDSELVSLYLAIIGEINIIKRKFENEIENPFETIKQVMKGWE